MRSSHAALAVFAASALLTAPVEAKTLRWSSQGDLATMDPYAHTESFTSNMHHHIYDPLVRRNRSLDIEPALATSWSILAPDRWRFVLRRDVKFHDGAAFTADDVVTSIERLLDPAARARGNLANVVRAEKIDDFTVDFVLKGPYPLLLNDLSGIFIMDKEWLVKHDAVKPGNITTGVTTHASIHANGTGPFKLESYQPDSKTVMVVNETWWDKPQHNLTRIEFRPIRSDATRVAALLSGEIDMMAPAPLQDLGRISAAPGFKIVEEPSLRVIFFGLNWRPELLAQPGEKNPLLDLRVRQALWHAIDLESIQRRIMRGKSRNIGILVAPPVPGYAADADKSLPFNPDLAKKLLADAGYAKGFKIGLACPNDRYIADEQICVAVGAMWSRIGIEVAPKTESRATYFPKVDRGETDIYMIGWATLPPMDAYSVLSALLASRKDGFGGNNPNGLVHARLDELTRLSGVELDEGKRRAMLTEALKIAHDQVLFVPLHQQPVAWAMRDAIDVPQFADEYVRLWFANVK
jgi:peptide/nickel transport system substrate-binding protein